MTRPSLLLRLLATAVAAAAVFAAQAPAAPPARIQVHGHWLIVVRDTRGRVVDRRAFENSYVAGANGGVLTKLLSESRVPGRWSVLLLADTGDGSETPGGLWTIPICGVGHTCTIAESVSPATGTSTQKTLTRGETTTNGVTDVTLHGTFVADTKGAIMYVESHLSTCAATVTIASCRTATSGVTDSVFTRTGIEDPKNPNYLNPIIVKKNQQVDVSIRFSFS